jgi:cytochrome c-type biogenesis protein CcmH/NrfG
MIPLLLVIAQGAQDEGATTADVPNAMGAHTWFIIIAAGAFLLWCISYSLQLHKEALARKKGREDLVRRKEQLIDRIAELEAQNEAGTIKEKQYKQDLKDLKFQLSKILEKLGHKA